MFSDCCLLCKPRRKWNSHNPKMEENASKTELVGLKSCKTFNYAFSTVKNVPNFLYLVRDNLVGYPTTTDGLDFWDPDISQSTVLENRMHCWWLAPLIFSQDSNQIYEWAEKLYGMGLLLYNLTILLVQKLNYLANPRLHYFTMPDALRV